MNRKTDRQTDKQTKLTVAVMPYAHASTVLCSKNS